MMAETQIELQGRRGRRKPAACLAPGSRTRPLRRLDYRGAVRPHRPSRSQLRRAFTAEAELQSFVRARLRRRATALARIGVAYRCVRADAASSPLLAMMGIAPAHDIHPS